jgi:multiple sugar transport system substrate-binding protein
MSAEEQGPAEGTTRIDRRRFLGAGGRFALAAAVTGPGLTVLSACGGSDSKSGGGAKQISLWNFYGPGGPIKGQSDWFVKLADTWNKSNAVKVKLRYIPIGEYISGSALQTAFAAGRGPDVFLVSPGDFLRYSNGGALVDLTDTIGKEALNDFAPGALDSRSVKGRVYGVPMEIEPLAMFYGEAAFEKAGLSQADVPSTWDDLLNVAHKLRRGKQYGVQFETIPGYYQNFTWYPFMWMGGGSPVSKDGKSSAFDSDAVVAALDLWRRTISEGLAPRKPLGNGGGDTPANLGSGFTAIQQSGIWTVSDMKANKKDFRYGVFKLPTPPGGSYTTDLGGWAFVANRKGKNPEAAAKFCAWALASMSPDSIERGRQWNTVVKTNLPARKSVQEQASKHGVFQSGPLKTFAEEIAPPGRGEPRYPPEIYKAISDAVQSCQLKGADPKSAASKASQTIDNFLQSYSGAPII